MHEAKGIQENETLTIPPSNAWSTNSAAKRPLRILVFSEGVSFAHVSRPVRLAQWALEKGHDVQFACGGRHAELAKAEIKGASHTNLPTIASETFYNRIRKNNFFYTEKELNHYIQAERSIIRSYRPDLILSDFRLTASISAALEKIPMVSLLNSYWSAERSLKLLAPHCGIFSKLPTKLQNRIVKTLTPIAIRNFAKPLDRIRHKHGLPLLQDFRKHYAAGNWCAYCDHPEFSPLNDKSELPDGHFYLGPIIWKPQSNSANNPTSIIAPVSQRKLVYISAGSDGDLKGLIALGHVINQLDLNCVFSGISDERISELLTACPQLKGRYQSKQFMEPRAVLSKAKVTICHGGSGTVYQSLTHGVPVLCLPSNGDQNIVSDCAECAGVGLTLFPKMVTNESLKRALQKLIEQPTLKANAEHLQCKLKNWDTRKHWLSFLNGIQPMVFRPHTANANQLKGTQKRPALLAHLPH